MSKKGRQGVRPGPATKDPPYLVKLAAQFGCTRSEAAQRAMDEVWARYIIAREKSLDARWPWFGERFGTPAVLH